MPTWALCVLAFVAGEFVTVAVLALLAGADSGEPPTRPHLPG